MSDIYAIPVYRYKNNKLCSAFEEVKENEEFVSLADFNETEKRLKKRIRELSEKQADDRQSYYECLYKQEPIEANNKICNLTFCQYNTDRECTNDKARKECVEVSRKILCINEENKK
jgi:hypothetical protein|uniref:Uncharacterized protein n=1 Tax=Siphoviridae sp. ctGDt6 TaxID=2825408 RepID=A0A8S5U825_9CAUD|nr:MAG TPA: hypothetical protein [Siphoviridae sp. ctGDt6]